MDVNVIPPEIWNHIFSFACTDDGSTGRALSAVSRAIHILSQPSKYQSLCVLGPKQIVKLFEVLSALSAEARKVKFMFVAGLDDRVGSGEGGRGLHVDAAEQALDQMVQLLAPSLVALHTKKYKPPLLFDIEFPVLSELALYGPFKSTTLRSPGCLFPSLRTLHIEHFGPHPTQFLEQIVHTAPSVTHLHVREYSFSQIQVALGILQPTSSSSALAHWSLDLRSLVIELRPMPGSLGSPMSNMRELGRRIKFRETLRKDPRIRLVEGSNGDGWSRLTTTVTEAKEMWLEDRW
ncbi:hypothetical protein C8R46DRAFT_1193852 [Mycena filopes]|nr:hypothetical protein C8R46DRAFT_1193852 [Mycena filopes]